MVHWWCHSDTWHTKYISSNQLHNFFVGQQCQVVKLLYGKCVITSWVAQETFFCIYFAYKWFVFCTFTILCPVHVKCKLVLVLEIFIFKVTSTLYIYFSHYIWSSLESSSLTFYPWSGGVSKHISNATLPSSTKALSLISIKLHCRRWNWHSMGEWYRDILC